MTAPEVWFVVWLALFGVCIGSFLNVVIYRLPRGEFPGRPRSFCPECREPLSWRDLIPVLSYILLRGRCRRCAARISPRYPLVEATCAALAVLCYYRFGFAVRTPLAFGVAAILLAVALIDLDVMEIPDRLIVALIPFAVCSVWAWRGTTLLERVIGFFAVSVPMLLIAFAVKDAFGGGDYKLMAVCGFFLGWKSTLVAFFIALLTGGTYAAYLLVSGRCRKDEHIAFGPHLCFGVLAAVFFGAELMGLYLRMAGW